MITTLKTWYADWLLWRLLRVGQRLARVQSIYEGVELEEYTEIFLGHLERRIDELSDTQRRLRERVNRLDLDQ